MLRVDGHLEKALEEYNQKVNALEAEGATRELLDAYVNRGCILSMMGMNVSAITDFEEASSILTYLEDSGNTVDPGYFVRIHVALGELSADKDKATMVDEYRIASSALERLMDGSKYYDYSHLVDMCLDCASDLVDSEFHQDSVPFTDKAMSLMIGKDDEWTRNRYVECCNISGQALMYMERNEDAYEMFDEAVRVGEPMYRDGTIDDEMEVVYAYISRSDMCETLSKPDEAISDKEAAVKILEDLIETDSLDDTEIYEGLCGELTSLYREKGDIKSAERYMMKQAAMCVNHSRGDDGSDY
ncbi:MAG: hypothetical protein MJZ68_03715 [archaeon]|nr:hypothetical protein [archaeon]